MDKRDVCNEFINRFVAWTEDFGKSNGDEVALAIMNWLAKASRPLQEMISSQVEKSARRNNLTAEKFFDKLFATMTGREFIELFIPDELPKPAPDSKSPPTGC